MALAAVLVAATGCAGPLASRDPSWRVSGGAADGWRALATGQTGTAVERFRTTLLADADDSLALFGDASVAFERVDVRRAVKSYLALLERAARSPDGYTPLLSAMAAGRLSVLLDEFGGTAAERAEIEDRLLAIRLSDLPWETRYELAVGADRLARRRGDVELLGRVGRAAGCVRSFKIARQAGVMPHLDLDTPADKASGTAGTGERRVDGRGCVVAVPAYDGRAGSQRVFADIETPGGGWYDVVLDFPGEARVGIDGSATVHHGDENTFGPRVSATRFALGPGRHRLELRLATFGGRTSLTVLVVPARTTAPVPVIGARPVGAPGPSVAAEPDLPGPKGARPPLAGGPADPALVLARAYVASRLGDAPRAWVAGAELERARRFSIGLAVAALVARDDPSRPANFGRDRARGLLRGAVAIDPALARARHGLAVIALEDDRPREALDEALAATRSAPGWWMAELTLHAAYRLRGLAWDADRALDRALVDGPGACAVVQAALGRAEDRRDAVTENRLAERLSVCGRDSDDAIERLRRRDDLAGVEAAQRRLLALAPEREDQRMELAGVVLARGRADEAVALLEPLLADDRRDTDRVLRLADALMATGPDHRAQARALVARLLNAHPDAPEIVRAARVLDVPLPVGPYRLNGRDVIGAFESSGRRYQAPAVVVLDRTVTRVFPSGAEMTLTHEIVRLQSKDAIQKWGEIAISDRAEVLTLRTHKADGSTREPEEFAGKSTISAADLAIGDYVEKETVEVRPPRDAFVVPAKDFAGGYLGDRFYFQSFDAPLDRSEYLLVTTPEAADRMRFDARAGAPLPVRGPALPAAATDGASAPTPTVVTTFAATRVPQLFAERASVPPIEHVPSVRASVGIDWGSWARFVREQLYGSTRTSPGLVRAAADIRAMARGNDEAARAAALVAWVGQNVEAEDDLRASASSSVARGRGNRLAVLVALARELGLTARPVLARSRLTAEGEAPTPLEEADDFADPLVRFEWPGFPPGQRPSIEPAKNFAYVDPRLKHAPFGYLPPGLDGARVVVLGTGEFGVAHGRSGDHRAVDMSVRLDGQGGGVASAAETLRGWPALEWAEIVDRFGPDQAKLRQDFEQRWLGVQFPGAVLKDLEIEILGTDGRSAGPAAAPGEKPAPVVAGTPYTAAEVRLRYSFTSPRLAVKRDREIRFLPTFFRSQPGRRYATEPRRGTALLTGFDVPLDLRARVELPEGARLMEAPRAGSGAARGGEVARRGGYRFLEERRVENPSAASPVLLLRREARLPIMRVPLQDYPSVADELRRVDALEQEEVRIGVGPERP